MLFFFIMGRKAYVVTQKKKKKRKKKKKEKQKEEKKKEKKEKEVEKRKKKAVRCIVMVIYSNFQIQIWVQFPVCCWFYTSCLSVKYCTVG